MIAFRWFSSICVLLLLSAGAFAKVTVVIDAGHGGHDRGGHPGQRMAEKGHTLDVAKRLERALKSAGYNTVMTRRSDVFVGLGARCAIANRYRNAIFVSIHFNGASNYKAYGIETYYYRGSKSAALASTIHRCVLSATGTMDRRIRSRGFYVLRKTRVPAVLCELGFLTNREEANKVASSAYRQKLADAIAKAIKIRY